MEGFDTSVQAFIESGGSRDVTCREGYTNISRVIYCQDQTESAPEEENRLQPKQPCSKLLIKLRKRKDVVQLIGSLLLSTCVSQC